MQVVVIFKDLFGDRHWDWLNKKAMERRRRVRTATCIQAGCYAIIYTSGAQTGNFE
jgi:hypothetical protein